MRKNLPLTRFRNYLTTAAIAVGLVTAGASLPAEAHVGVAMRSGTIEREHVQMHRHFKYARVRRGLTYRPSVPPDYCDLPSAGCVRYLAN